MVSMPRVCRRIWATGAALSIGLLIVTTDNAAATCMTEPFDQAVRRSETVVVATVVAARSTETPTIVVRLDVEDVLKGSAADGQRVKVTSCIPIISDAAVSPGPDTR
jgi:hypothetical protein